MTHEIWEHRSRKVMEWNCCGLKWQLKMITMKRRQWFPKCPVCESVGKCFDDLMKEQNAQKNT